VDHHTSGHCQGDLQWIGCKCTYSSSEWPIYIEPYLVSKLAVLLFLLCSIFFFLLCSKVSGSLWDMTRPLEEDCELKLFKFEDDEGRDTFWHSSAHILGEVLP
jgi:hypothetical protein